MLKLLWCKTILYSANYWIHDCYTY